MSRRLALILISVVAAVVLLEGLVRLSGTISGGFTAVSPDITVFPGNTILCIGDSFVSGVGGKGFPAQLQSVLNERYGSGAFRIVDLGRSGTNSSYVVSRLPAALRQYHPDAVIILTGISNSWKRVREDSDVSAQSWVERHVRLYRAYQLVRSGEYTFAAGKRRAARRLQKLEAEEDNLLKSAPRLSRKQRARLADLYCINAELAFELMDREKCALALDKAIAIGLDMDLPVVQGILRSCLSCDFYDRGFRLLDLRRKELEASHAAKFLRAQEASARGDFYGSKKFLEEAIKMRPAFWVYHATLGSLMFRQDAQVAVRYYREAMRLAPNLAQPHYGLGLWWLWSSDYRDAEAEFKLALRADPTAADALRRLADVYVNGGVSRRFESLRWEIPALSGSPEYRKIVQSMKTPGGLNGTPQGEWVADVSEAVLAARKAGAAVIVSSYPDRNLEGMRAAADKNGAQYVDLTGIFRTKFRSRQEYIWYDLVHCNTAGYGLMAEVYASELERLFGLKKTGAASAAPVSKPTKPAR